MNKWFENQLAQIAIMHYKQGISQKDISDLLGLSKMTISRMLKKAIESKIITIQIKSPFKVNRAVGKRLEKKYQLEEEKAIVVKDNGKQELSDFLAGAGAFYLGAMDLNNKIIGVGVGNTVGLTVNYLTPIRSKNTHIIQLMGGLITVSDSNPLTIVQNMCKKLEAKGTFLASNATVENRKMKESIISSSGIKKINLGKKDIAMFGIGSVGRGTLLAPGLVKEEEFEELKRKGAVGDICGHCFNKEGKFIGSSLEDRLVCISLKQLKKFKNRIAIAGGKHKAKAIKGSLCSGVITAIVIDEDTAKEII